MLFLLFVLWANTESGFLYCERSQPASPALQTLDWGSATFRGITIGQSTASDLRKRWGVPDSTGNWDWDNPKKPKYRLYHYRIRGKYKATITAEVETRTSKVIAMEMSPEEMTLEQAISIFGSDYIRTRYSFCHCPSDEFFDGEPIFESSEGNMLYLEYRRRGMAIAVNVADRVTTIRFINKPIGFKSAAECQKVTGCSSPH